MRTAQLGTKDSVLGSSDFLLGFDPLPFEKEWQFAVNQEQPWLPNPDPPGIQIAWRTPKSLLWKIKNSLVSFPSNPWVAVRSFWYHDWGTPPTGGVVDGDSWFDLGDISWNSGAGTPATWIVLQQSAIAPSFQICLYTAFATGADAEYLHVIVFPTGYTYAGDSTHRPSAANEIDMTGYSGTWGVYQATLGAWSTTLHVMMSTDGECTRMFFIMNRQGALETSSLWLFEKPKNPVSGGYPFLATMIGHGNTSNPFISYFQLQDINSYSHGNWSSRSVNYYLTSEGYGSGTLGENLTTADEDTGGWSLCPVQLSIASVVPVRGARKGDLADLWWGSTSVDLGSTYPGDGTKQLVQVGHLVFPWNGTTFLQKVPGT
jgi:hypothetical protein